MTKDSNYKYKGVYKKNGKWIAQCGFGMKKMGKKCPRHLGTFDTPEQAAMAYDLELLKTLNFPKKAYYNFEAQIKD